MDFIFVATGILLDNASEIHQKYPNLVEENKLLIPQNSNGPVLLIAEGLVSHGDKPLSRLFEINKPEPIMIKPLDINIVVSLLPIYLQNDRQCFNHIMKNGQSGLWCYMIKY